MHIYLYLSIYYLQPHLERLNSARRRMSRASIGHLACERCVRVRRPLDVRAHLGEDGLLLVAVAAKRAQPKNGT